MSEELQYIDLVKDVLENGIEENDRTGVGTLSVFGRMNRWTLSKDFRFPLLTTKRVFWRAVVAELLWFIRGETDAKILQQQDVRIWDGNTSRQFLDGRGLCEYEDGDIGPGYGFQWRHFGATYKGCNADYSGEGVDQLQSVIDSLMDYSSHLAEQTTGGSNRRMIVSAWNPTCLEQMALPPCHMMAQFYIGKGGKLSCSMYQRSCDVGLGVPFNIASYALLTCLLAHHCGLERGDFVHFMGNVHIYKDHIDAIKEQVSREPRPFPQLEIVAPRRPSITDYCAADFDIKDYTPHAPVKMRMAV